MRVLPLPLPLSLSAAAEPADSRLNGNSAEDWHAVSKEVGAAHAWSSPWYWTAVDSIYQAWEVFLLHRTAGPMVLPNPLNGDKIVVGGGGSDTTVS